jgi:tetratricopeptide (TPR) repeat protein
LEAKIKAGSISEHKQNAKVAKLLNSARKSVIKGKNQDAINSYWKVLELDSQEPYAYLELGEIYKNLKIYDRSIEMLSSGLELGKDELDIDTLCKYYCILTEAYSATNQQGLANKSLIKAAEIAPRNPMPRKILGDIYLKNNRVANATKAYRKALELDPYYEPATKALNELKLEYGNKLPQEDKDKDYIKKVAVKLAPDNDNNKKNKNKQKAEKTNEKHNIIIKEETEKKETTNIDELDNDIEIPKSYTEMEESKEKTITISDSRPLPLSEKELAKIEKKKKKKQEENEKAKKPQTEEEIEKAISEKETQYQSDLDIEKSKSSDYQQYIDLFLAGNPTEKEEAINYFINQGKPGLEAVEELVYDPNPNVRIMAVRALPLFDDYKDEVKTFLEDVSNEVDQDQDVIKEINNALSLL